MEGRAHILCMVENPRCQLGTSAGRALTFAWREFNSPNWCSHFSIRYFDAPKRILELSIHYLLYVRCFDLLSKCWALGKFITMLYWISLLYCWGHISYQESFYCILNHSLQSIYHTQRIVGFFILCIWRVFLGYILSHMDEWFVLFIS